MVVLLVGGNSAYAQSDQPPRYKIGTIPDQTAWHNGTNQFLVHWNDKPRVSFVLETYPQPMGVLSIAPFDGSNWLYQYIPAAPDKAAFSAGTTRSSKPNSSCRPRKRNC